MLKLIYSMADLDTEQLLNVYKEHAWDERDFLSYLREDFFRQKGAIYAIWTEGTVYKSAVRLEPYRDGLLLHSLETEPTGRRRGYAVALMDSLLTYLGTTDSKRIYSHVNKRNRASLALHKKCGFEIFSDSATYIDGTVTQYCYTLCISL